MNNSSSQMVQSSSFEWSSHAIRKGESAVEARQRFRVDQADEMLTARIHRRLRETGRRQLAELSISVHGGCVHMAGKVPSYYAKQLAHQAALSIDGVERIQCAIEVN